MKKKQIIIIVLLIAVAAVGLYLFLIYRNNGKAVDGVYSENTSADPCECETSWFPHEQTPPPKEGDGSPFDSANTTNCDFHQWSWQKFLWLTKPLPNGNPLFLDSLKLVTPEMAVVPLPPGLKLVLSSINQAGSEGVLLSNPKINKIADTVYYSIHVNNKFFDKATRMADSIYSKKIPYSNLETFPVGAVELKVSWVNADAIPKDRQADYFITKASVMNKNKKYVQKNVALLGMHVVGVVKNHPEFIWATFEHQDMAPVYDKKDNVVTSANEKLLYEKGTTSGLKGITWDSISPLEPNKAFILYEYGVPKEVGSNSYMATSQAEPANFNNIVNINKCVASKLKGVFRNYFYNGSIWLNFDGMSSEEQAVAIVTRKISSALPDSLARGSVNLANITMETYTQTFKKDIHAISNKNLVNCFTCHQSKNIDTINKGKSPLYLSHVFESYLYTNTPVPAVTAKNANSSLKSRRIEETRKLKVKQFEDFVRENK
ncbi:hypothetical protein [Flavobacterium sp. N502540]|uniref:hypothetical protein n=1 Tax=Flavobacterium sp. N502540 TaxID=2986838 RepID=UPI0022243E94|nr:hypothetical protein [Flavobacterium sp. N502540]